MAALCNKRSRKSIHQHLGLQHQMLLRLTELQQKIHRLTAENPSIILGSQPRAHGPEVDGWIFGTGSLWTR
jgi:hypothetical protein